MRDWVFKRGVGGNCLLGRGLLARLVGVNLTHSLDFFGFKFLLLDRLPKALAQLFLVCEHIF